ncbi:MAG: hypothetical protein HZA63_02215, partial [Rhodocyclales bacterium]|nr:hypothetical protein [Rhodocyclales bacterium]
MTDNVIPQWYSTVFGNLGLSEASRNMVVRMVNASATLTTDVLAYAAKVGTQIVAGDGAQKTFQPIRWGRLANAAVGNEAAGESHDDGIQFSVAFKTAAQDYSEVAGQLAYLFQEVIAHEFSHETNAAYDAAIWAREVTDADSYVRIYLLREAEANAGNDKRLYEMKQSGFSFDSANASVQDPIYLFGYGGGLDANMNRRAAIYEAELATARSQLPANATQTEIEARIAQLYIDHGSVSDRLAEACRAAFVGYGQLGAGCDMTMIETVHGAIGSASGSSQKPAPLATAGDIDLADGLIFTDRNGNSTTVWLGEDGSYRLDEENAAGTISVQFKSLPGSIDVARITEKDSSGSPLSVTTRRTLTDGTIIDDISRSDGSVIRRTTDPSGNVTEVPVESGAQTLTAALTKTVDALALLRAIKSGEPLPILASGLRLTADFNPGDTALGGASNVASGILSLAALDKALENRDGVGALTSAANALSFGVRAYENFAAVDGIPLQSELGTFLNGSGGTNALGLTDGVLPYLNLVNSLAHGDAIDIASAILTLNPVTAPLGVALQVADMIFGGLFGGNEAPPPWGGAQAAWDNGHAVSRYWGESGGEATAKNLMDALIDNLEQLAAQVGAANPGLALGVIANRLPGLSYRAGNGLALADVDPLSGEQRNAELRYDVVSYRPINATPGSELAGQSFSERFLRAALEAGAIAPDWEVATAALQTAANDPQAGLTEEARAGRNGHLAAAETGATQTMRVVALDLDGGGIAAVSKTASGVAFDVDDSGYLKATGWIGGGDGFLVLDRNLNGSIDTGKELFSNSTVDLSQRGLRGLQWLDANLDGWLDASDPVFGELKVWRDANQDGVAANEETQTLADLGVGGLHYAMGTYTRNGEQKQMTSVDLAADTAGTIIRNVPEGIVVATSDGKMSLVVTHVTDTSAVAPGRNAVGGYEDLELIVSGADLLANQTLGGASASALSITGVNGFRHGTGFLDGNGFVHFMPEANYFGADAGFEYSISAPTGETGTGRVDIALANVNDAPTATVDPHLMPIYGYSGTIDESGTLTLGAPVFSPGLSYGADGSLRWCYTPIGTADTDGPNSATVVAQDIDDPSGPFTYTVVSQPTMGGASIDANGNVQYINWTQPNMQGTLETYDENGTPTTETQADPFLVRVTDAHGASSTVTINAIHRGAYFPNTGSGGGGGKKPISIDLDRNGFQFKGVDDSGVFFDINDDGWKRKVGWVGAGDGWLAYDEDGDGKIDKGSELAFAARYADATSDLAGLAAIFDSNRDGLLSAADSSWNRFGIWNDADGDGVTDSGELQSLDAMGVASIELTSDGAFSVINGVTVQGIAKVHLSDGSVLDAADAIIPVADQVRMPDGSIATQAPHAAGVVTGTPGNDLLLGKTGSTRVTADAGDDVVMTADGNDFIDAGAGDDVVYSGDNNDIVLGAGGNDVVFAGQGDDLIVGGDGHDALSAEDGNDIVFGGQGNDLISGGTGSDALSGDLGDDTLSGETGSDALFGGDGNDALLGGDGDDRLDGGLGADTLQGGLGDDTYATDSTDTVIELAGAGVDTVVVGDAYVLPDNVENAIQTRGGFTVVGNDLNNRLAGSDGLDTLVGGLGDDTYVIDATDMVVEYAGEGTDTIVAAFSYTVGVELENLALTGTADINGTGNDRDNRITGNDGSNVLSGGAGNDVLDGGLGADVMNGGGGADTYYVDNVGDVIHEVGDGSWDVVYSSVTYSLADGGTNELRLVGTAALNGTGSDGGSDYLYGNDGSNILTALGGNDKLDGGAGADTLIGGSGNDTYIVDDLGDVVTENAGEGTDTVQSSISWTLAANVENLTLTGTGAINGTGNALDNVLTGTSGANVLDGGAGADAMNGGGGSDTYVVDNAGDIVTENANAGTDIVQSSLSWTLGANVEILLLTGTNAINGMGNGLNNILIGNAGANVLDGGAGADAMNGGSGNDTYVVDNAGDSLAENADEGTDTVQAARSWTLDDNFENLTLTGTAALSGTGNVLDNILTGNAAANVLDGGGGADVMNGGGGSDTYVVDNAGDAVTENANAGTDIVQSSLSWTL